MEGLVLRKSSQFDMIVLNYRFTVVSSSKFSCSHTLQFLKQSWCLNFRPQ